jgi:hypothetical protein
MNIIKKEKVLHGGINSFKNVFVTKRVTIAWEL